MDNRQIVIGKVGLLWGISLLLMVGCHGVNELAPMAEESIPSTKVICEDNTKEIPPQKIAKKEVPVAIQKEASPEVTPKEAAPSTTPQEDNRSPNETPAKESPANESPTMEAFDNTPKTQGEIDHWLPNFHSVRSYPDKQQTYQILPYPDLAITLEQNLVGTEILRITPEDLRCVVLIRGSQIIPLRQATPELHILPGAPEGSSLPSFDYLAYWHPGEEEVQVVANPFR